MDNQYRKNSQSWQPEAGSRIQGSRHLDDAKVQAPCIVRTPEGGYRLFYTAVGSAKPFPHCQGYILSAVSQDGLQFVPEPGIRLAPRPGIPYMALRVLAPSITALSGGGWRMYFEARGVAGLPSVICSAFSDNQLQWELEEGIRLFNVGSLGAPRFIRLADGSGRLFCFQQRNDPGWATTDQHMVTHVVSATTDNGIDFTFDPGYHLRDRTDDLDGAGITAAEVIQPEKEGGSWTMYYSAWQDVPPGQTVPLHPSKDKNSIQNGGSVDFAKASIAADMAGYRSRIFCAHSKDGIHWLRQGVVIEGQGYGADGIDAVHAEDMSLISIGDGSYRMYYAACDKEGNWRIASAVKDL
jgi:hypothetical protein